MTRRVVYQSLIVAIVIAAVAAAMNKSESAASGQSRPAASARGPEIGVLHAQRFELARPAKHTWRRGWPEYDSGWLLVLDLDPTQVRPRQTLEPVLFVGRQTAWRVNVGAESGHVVAVVPGDFSLTDAPLFFGEPALPERIEAADISRELARARADGVRPPTADQVSSVLGGELRLPDVQALEALAVDLVERYSPQEQDWVRSMRVPLLK